MWYTPPKQIDCWFRGGFSDNNHFYFFRFYNSVLGLNIDCSFSRTYCSNIIIYMCIMWTKTNWNKIIKIIITTFFAINCIFFTAIALSTTDDLPEVNSVLGLNIDCSFSRTYCSNIIIYMCSQCRFAVFDFSYIGIGRNKFNIFYIKCIISFYIKVNNPKGNFYSKGYYYEITK